MLPGIRAFGLCGAVVCVPLSRCIEQGRAHKAGTVSPVRLPFRTSARFSPPSPDRLCHDGEGLRLTRADKSTPRCGYSHAPRYSAALRARWSCCQGAAPRVHTRGTFIIASRLTYCKSFFRGFFSRFRVGYPLSTVKSPRFYMILSVNRTFQEVFVRSYKIYSLILCKVTSRRRSVILPLKYTPTPYF